MGLLFLSTLIDYYYGFGVASSNRKKAKVFLWLSLINNLGILGLFKYYDFFVLEFQKAIESFGLHSNPVLLQVALPVGISFYTFHGMSYVFDIYNGKQRPVNNFIDYAVFVSFFPLLVAGPIERANHLLPQIQRPRLFNYKQSVEGCRLILWGLFKKVIVADSLAPTVDAVFDGYESLSGMSLLIGAITFSFQIYGDFSGYSDIAIGTAKLFGIELLSNFKFPYFSRNVSEFWRRWHISLSSWFRDYVYIPLGGSRKGRFITVRNTLIIFLLSGFWHGASWNFVVWGLVHAFAFLPVLFIKKGTNNDHDVVAMNNVFPSLFEIIRIFSTFIFVTIAWVFFRSNNLSIALNYLYLIYEDFVNNPKQLLSLPSIKSPVLYIVPLIMFDWYFRHDERRLKVSTSRFANYIVYLIFSVLIIASMTVRYFSSRKVDFIYFQF